ncbi:MAG: phosphatase PAP2 family protein [Chlorobi bacterium]|nr:phosphatase PAP2 family protein [Chlorobiota bacterium]MCI0715950.1 phosphatase PAP2 family protein [Chlorobiota bacterium]
MKKILLIVVIFAFNSSLHSDSTIALKKIKPKTTIWQDLGSDLKYFAVDWGAYLTCPFRMDTKDLIISSSVIAGTVLSSTVDKDFRNAVSRRGFETYNHDFWDAPTAYGFVQYPSIFSGVLYAIGLATRESEIRKTGRMLAQALAYSGTLTIGLRYLFGRHRPFTSEKNQYEFSWLNTAGDTQSFPSGHIVVAVATSTILAEQIDTWWARVVLYGFAGLTAYARLYNDKHWLSDVIFGTALGYGSAKFVLNREREREQNEKQKLKKKGGGFSLYPSINGINAVYLF